MGISILSGSITTILAVVILFICVIVVFMKFAVFVIATIVLSILYSLGFFAACSHVVGPDGNFGNFSHIY